MTLECPICEWEWDVEVYDRSDTREDCPHCASILRVRGEGGYGDDGRDSKWWLEVVEARCRHNPAAWRECDQCQSAHGGV